MSAKLDKLNAIDKKEKLTEEEAVIVRRGEDSILKAQVLNCRMQGMSLIQISRKFGIPQKELQHHLIRWLRESVGYDGELGQVLADLTFSRYEELLSKILPVLFEEDVKSVAFKNLVKIFQDLTDRQLRVAGIVVDEQSKANVADDSNLEALEEEARRLGMNV